MKEITYLWEKMKPYRKKKYIFAFDTNVLIDSPGIIKFLTREGEKVYISRTVYDELDKQKTSKEFDSDSEKKRAAKVREALREIEKTLGKETKVLGHVKGEYVKSLGLSNTKNDDKIVASYQKEKETDGVKILFITADRGARIVASTVELEFLDFDIQSYKDSLKDYVFERFPDRPKKTNNAYYKKKQKKAQIKLLKWIFIILVAISIYNFKQAFKEEVQERSYYIEKTVISEKVNFVYSDFEYKNGKTTFDITINNESDEVIEFPRNFWIKEKGEENESFLKRNVRGNKRYAEQVKIYTKDGKVLTAGFMSSEHFEHTNDTVKLSVETDIENIKSLETSYKIGKQEPKNIKVELKK